MSIPVSLSRGDYLSIVVELVKSQFPGQTIPIRESDILEGWEAGESPERCAEYVVLTIKTFYISQQLWRI